MESVEKFYKFHGKQQNAMANLETGAEQFVQFGRVHHEGQFCEIILNLDQWIRRCRLKTFLIKSSGGIFVRRSGTICAILEECIVRNNSEKLFLIWTSC